MSEEQSTKFCPKCGAQLAQDADFCTKCGTSLKRNESSQPAQNESSQHVQTERKEKKKGKGKVIAIVIAAIIVIFALLVFMGSDEDGTASRAQELLEEVQNGYLGNYDTVTVREVIEYLYAGGEWTVGTSSDGEYYIVDFCNEEYIELQFTVYDDGSKTFEVTGIDSFTDDTDSYSKSALAAFLNSVYGSYISAYPECGLTAVADDEMDDDTVLQGHFGPVKSVTGSSENSDGNAEESEQSADSQEAEESEQSAVAEENEESSIDAVEGVYTYDNGSSIMTADITVTDDGAVYVSIEEYTYGGRYGAYYYERMDARLDDGSYYSTEADELSSACVTFYEGGMRFQFSGASDEYLVMDGDYQILESVNLYGTYSYDNGTDNVMTADIYVESDTGNTVIDLDAISYGDRYTAEFFGTLWRLYGNVYYTENEEYGSCYLTIEFQSDGMTVTVDEAELEEFYVLEGNYNKTADLNMDQVG